MSRAGITSTAGWTTASAWIVMSGALVEEVLSVITEMRLVVEKGGVKVTCSSNSLPGRTVLRAARNARSSHVGSESDSDSSRLLVMRTVRVWLVRLSRLEAKMKTTGATSNGFHTMPLSWSTTLVLTGSLESTMTVFKMELL